MYGDGNSKPMIIIVMLDDRNGDIESVDLFAEGIVCLREVALYETSLTSQQVLI